MTTVFCENYDITMQEEDGDEFKLYLREIMNKADTSLQPPKSRRFIVRVTDDKGDIAGGAIIWIYWGWLDVSQLALEEEARGQGLGRRLMCVLEDKARSEGCTRARVEAFGHQSLDFYQKLGYQIVGKLEDYPEGFDYYWLRKNL
jgi:GNAT superfamily N-acetyltransferase